MMDGHRKLSADEAWRFAHVLVCIFPDKAADFIAQRCKRDEVEEIVKMACAARGLDLSTAMSRSRAYITSDPPLSGIGLPTATQRTRRKSSPSIPNNNPALPTPPRSSQASSPVLVSAASKSQPLNDTRDLIIALGKQLQEVPLYMKHASQSHNLIREDIVHESLRLDCQNLIHELSVCHKDARLRTSQQVSLSWIRKGANKTRRSDFFLVTNMIDADIVLGDLKFHEASPWNDSTY
jgi:hypothetical protein